MPQTEELTIPEAIGFWRKNKSWLIPMITTLMGLLGGSQADKIGAMLPTPPEVPAVVKRVDILELRVTNLEKGTKTENDGIIHLGK